MRNREPRRRTPVNEGSSVRRVRLIAPSDLDGGFEFRVLFEDDGRVYMVTAPVQGVQQGQSFISDALLVQKEDRSAVDPENHEEDDDDVHVITREMAMAADPHHIPYGTFRDGLCVCAKHGCCHPFCCLGCWLLPCALGQILWRLRLDAFARPLVPNYDSPWTTFQKLTLAAFYYAIAIELYGTLSNTYGADENDDDEVEVHDTDTDTSKRNAWVVGVSLLSFLTTVTFSTYIILTLCKTRRWIRRRYNIPENCGSCSDCCCACCCPCCVVCQLGRHTAHYDEYPAHCCTDTGLGRGAPEIV